MKTFRPFYDQLTPEERVQLVLAAAVRGDEEEATRLAESCPGVKATIGDPAYTDLLDRMKHAGMEVLLHWFDVSHRFVRTRQAVKFLDRLALTTEMLVLVAPVGKKELKLDARWDRAALATGEAACKALECRVEGHRGRDHAVLCGARHHDAAAIRVHAPTGCDRRSTRGA